MASVPNYQRSESQGSQDLDFSLGNAVALVNTVKIYIPDYSNHRNTEHLKSAHLIFQSLFCLVFKWSDQVIR